VLACGILANTYVAKLYMSFGIRISGKIGTDEGANASKAQLNEAEYSGPFLAALLYLSAKGVECSYGGVIALLGQVVYTWSRIFGLPIFPIGALTRYIALPMLITSIYKTLD